MSFNSNTVTMEALRKRDPNMVKRIFERNIHSLKWLMWESGISGYLPHDLFNDIMLNIYMMTDKPDFRLTCSIDTYFIKIAQKHIAYFKYRKDLEYAPIMTGTEEAEEIADPALYEELFEMKNLLELARKTLLSMQTACKRILNLAFLGYSNSEAAARLKRSETAVRTLKKKCRKRFIEAMNGDPSFKDIRKDTNLNKTDTA